MMLLKLLIVTMILTACTSEESNDFLQSLPSNSCEEMYKTKYPNLNYSYDSITQKHDHSNNWDFDGDGEKDKLLLIGKGAAHLYFHLQISLSSDSKKYDFPFLSIDFPNLFNELELDNEGYPFSFQQFVVADFDDDKLPEIYISLDEKSEIPQKWKAKGLSFRQVIVDYSKGRLELKNYQ